MEALAFYHTSAFGPVFIIYGWLHQEVPFGRAMGSTERIKDALQMHDKLDDKKNTTNKVRQRS